MMTPQELLTDRYKVTIPYPCAKYEVGDIIPTYESAMSYAIESDDYSEKICLKDYPDIFKPLKWWEDRKIEDMPMYLKMTGYVDSKNNPVADIYIKVREHFKSASGDWRNNSYAVFIPEADPKGTLNYGAFLPSTEEEFNNFYKS